jgi:hypothetical protein
MLRLAKALCRKYVALAVIEAATLLSLKYPRQNTVGGLSSFN